MSEGILKKDDNMQKNDGKEEEKNIILIEENENKTLERIWKLLIDE